jgi:hypothetical protein
MAMADFGEGRFPEPDIGLGHFGDRRFQKNRRQALKRLYARSSATACRISDSRAEEVGFTRFFRNPYVMVKEILETAAARTAQAVAGRHSLVIQDTSEINYQAKAGPKRNLGRVGNGTDAGPFVHPALDGSVTGLEATAIWRWDKVKDPTTRNCQSKRRRAIAGSSRRSRRAKR